jgi:hypothetical protein
VVDEFLRTLPALITAASRALLLAIRRQLLDITRSISRFFQRLARVVLRAIRRLWSLYEAVEGQIVGTLADGALALYALRFFLLLLAIAVALAWARFWIVLIVYVVFLAVALLRYFKLDRAAVDQEIKIGSPTRDVLSVVLRWAVRLGLTAFSLYITIRPPYPTKTGPSLEPLPTSLTTSQQSELPITTTGGARLRSEVSVQTTKDMSTVSGAGMFSASGQLIARFTSELANAKSSAPAIWARQITIWNGSTGAIVRRIKLHGTDAMAEVLAFDKAGSRIAAEDDNGVVQIWNASTGDVLHRIPIASSRVSALCFDSSGTRLAVGLAHGTVEIWDVSEQRRLAASVDTSKPAIDRQFKSGHHAVASETG